MKHVGVILLGMCLLSHPMLSDTRVTKTSTINLHRALGSKYACVNYPSAIQFLSESELLLLAGPTRNCYQAVDQLELVVLSLDGQIRARKPWPSTYSRVVISPGRIAAEVLDGIQILDNHLNVIQRITLPKQMGLGFLSADGSGGLSFGKFACSGTPLSCVEGISTPRTQNNATRIYTYKDGRKLESAGNFLLETREGEPSKSIANLNWVAPPCDKYTNCQTYDAGTQYQVVIAGRHRILITSNGSKFPITDAAGLFPYFRLQIFDLDTGSEVYRDQEIFKTGQRSAVISPEGDLLATFDGDAATVHTLKR